MRCFECFYSMFGTCPTDGSHNAACLTLAKGYMTMSRKELEEATEKAYKDALINAAKLYNSRMTYIDIMFNGKKEEVEDEIVH